VGPTYGSGINDCQAGVLAAGLELGCWIKPGPAAQTREAKVGQPMSTKTPLWGIVQEIAAAMGEAEPIYIARKQM